MVEQCTDGVDADADVRQHLVHNAKVVAREAPQHVKRHSVSRSRQHLQEEGVVRSRSWVGVREGVNGPRVRVYGAVGMGECG